MITTPDGVIDVNGSSGPLGGPADQARLLALRKEAAMVLVGAGTVRAEGYGPPSRKDLKIGVVTRSCQLDFSSALFSSGAGIVVCALDSPEVPVPSIRAGRGDIDFARIIEQLPTGLIHVEGGPVLNAALLDADMVDAINLTITPIVGGVPGMSIAHPTHQFRDFTLESATTHDNFVFTRYVRNRK